MDRPEWRAMVRECLDAEDRGDEVQILYQGKWQHLGFDHNANWTYYSCSQYRVKPKPRWRPLDRYEVGSCLGNDIFNECGDPYRVTAIFEDDRVTLRNKYGMTFDATLQQLLRYTTVDKKPIGTLENPE